MKKIITLALLSAFALNANALDLTINNQTEAKVAFAFSYLDKKSEDWVAEGWFNVEPNSKNELSLNTDNDIYYIYAQFSNGNKIEGGDSSLELKVDRRSFFKKQSDKDEGEFKATFVKARANSGKATINLTSSEPKNEK